MTRTLRRGASQTDGMLRWKSNEAWPWDAGAIDIKKALGVWLLGPPGWRRLDIILPEHRWTLAADNDEVLQKWVKLLEDVAPEKPVSEIRTGWMEKKGAVGGGWKLRFFVLLSTHELLYFESDRSPKCKGVIDLMRRCRATLSLPRLQLRVLVRGGGSKTHLGALPNDTLRSTSG